MAMGLFQSIPAAPQLAVIVLNDPLLPAVINIQSSSIIEKILPSNSFGWISIKLSSGFFIDYDLSDQKYSNLRVKNNFSNLGRKVRIKKT
jgi:hypothetical protein